MFPPSVPPSSSSSKDDDPFKEFTKPSKMKRGIFTGRWMRFSLSIEQQPVLCRRKTDKDRRSINPCPILRFRAIECRHHHIHHHHHSQSAYSQSGLVPNEEWVENEVDPIAIEPTLLICAARIEASRTQTHTHPSTTSKPHLAPASTVEVINLAQTNSASSSGTSADHASELLLPDYDGTLPVAIPGPNPYSTVTTARPIINRMDISFLSNSPTASTSGSAPSPTSISDEDQGQGRGLGSSRPYDVGENGYHASIPALNDSRGHTTDLPIAVKRPRREKEDEEVEKSRNLYGGLHVPAVRVPTIDGGTGTWFLFTDLAVRTEGTYTLRFQCYDITAVDSNGSQPSQSLVECQSQSFKVYSPRHVPPSPRPTPLAEHFIQQGFKLNTRKNERMEASPTPLN